MKRRTFVAAVSSSVTGVLVAGCISESDGETAETPSESTTTSETVEQQTTEQSSTNEANEAVTLASQELSSGEGVCDGEEHAMVSHESQTVGVRGAIETPNPCYNATVAESRVSETTGGTRFEVVIGSEQPDDPNCRQCVGTVSYTAEFSFQNELPDEIRVIHQNIGEGTTTVAESETTATTTDSTY
jgi:hypothetical protein